MLTLFSPTSVPFRIPKHALPLDCTLHKLRFPTTRDRECACVLQESGWRSYGDDKVSLGRNLELGFTSPAAGEAECKRLEVLPHIACALERLLSSPAEWQGVIISCFCQWLPTQFFVYLQSYKLTSRIFMISKLMKMFKTHQSEKSMVDLRTEVCVWAPTVENHIKVLEPCTSPTKTKLCWSSCVVLSVYDHQSSCFVWVKAEKNPSFDSTTTHVWSRDIGVQVIREESYTPSPKKRNPPCPLIQWPTMFLTIPWSRSCATMLDFPLPSPNTPSKGWSDVPGNWS